MHALTIPPLLRLAKVFSMLLFLSDHLSCIIVLLAMVGTLDSLFLSSGSHVTHLPSSILTAHLPTRMFAAAAFIICRFIIAHTLTIRMFLSHRSSSAALI